MWLLELMWVLTIILMLGFSLKVNDKIIHTVKFKHEVMLVHSYIAQNRLYQRYHARFFDFYNSRKYAFYYLVTSEDNITYNNYRITDMPKFKTDLFFYRGIDRLSDEEDFNPGSFVLRYDYGAPKPLHAKITVNRVGALRIAGKSWSRP